MQANYLISKLKKQQSAPLLEEKLVVLTHWKAAYLNRADYSQPCLLYFWSYFQVNSLIGAFLLHLLTLESKLCVRCESTALQTVPILLELLNLLLWSPASVGLWFCSLPAVSVSDESANSWVHLGWKKCSAAEWSF